ncbi:MAG: hypothetical protein ABEJ92_09120 [Halobacteriales archaeon]
MLETVRLALGRPGPSHTLYECRNCGTTVAAEDDDCPACGSDEVAAYDL